MAEQAETKYCSNCKRDIASVNFLMHEVHCRRNIVLCERCQEPVPRSEMEAHTEEMHAEEPCGLCGRKFEKCELDDHQGECPQRPHQCAYCELEMPFSEINGHQDYCGTRTERCTRCSQYIMVKDQARHDDTNCAYPTPKPKNTPTSNLPDNAHLYDIEPPEYSSFALDELSRMLDNDIPNNIAMGNTRSNRQRQTVANRERLGLHQNRPSNPIRTNNLPQSNATRTRLTKQRNAPRPQPQSPPPPQPRVESDDVSPAAVPDTDLDQLLAMHLQEDLGEGQDWGFLDTHSHNLLREDPAEAQFQPPPPSLPSPPPEIEDENFSIPCEFCGDAFSVDLLLQHQELCTLRPGFNDNPVPTRSLLDSPSFDPDFDPGNAFQDALNDIAQRGDSTPNNATTPTTNGPSSQPRIVDNLSYLEAHNRISSPPDNDPLDEDEVFLPCEFCDQLFPQENLVQHQAVCDGNSTYTPPRSQSPPMNRRAMDRTHGLSGNPRPDPQRAVRPRVFKRQPESSYQPRDNSVMGASRFNNPVPSYKNHTSSYQSRSTYSTRNGRNDRPMNFSSSLTSPGIRNPKNVPTPTTPSPTDGPEQRRRNSATRVRDTLDHLLEDPTCTNQDLANFVDKERKSEVNLQRQAQRNGNVTPGSRRGPRLDEDSGAGISSYRASFAPPSTSQYGRKSRTRPITQRTAEPGIEGAGSLRVNIHNSASNRGVDDTPSNIRSSSNRTRGGKKSTRPRRHPQGDA